MTSIFISPPSFNDFVVKNKGNDIPVGNSKTDMCHYRTRFPGRKKSMMHIYELCTFRCLKKIIRSTQYYPAQLPHGIFILNNKTLTCYFLKIRIHFLTKVIMGWTSYDLFSGHMHRNRCRGPWGSCPFVTEAERVSRDLPKIRAGTVMYYVSLWHQDGVYWTHCYHLMLLIYALLDVICN